MIKLNFGKVYFDTGGDYIKVNGRVFGVNDDSSLVWIEDWVPANFDESYRAMTLDEFNLYVTNQYKQLQISKSRKKVEKEFRVSTNHWWNTVSDEKKIELALRLRDVTEDIINSIISKYPTSKLNEYYLNLLPRAMYSNPIIPILRDKDIYKLPRYNSATDKIVGTDAQLLKLIAVMYPPSVRKSDKFKSY